MFLNNFRSNFGLNRFFFQFEEERKTKQESNLQVLLIDYRFVVFRYLISRSYPFDRDYFDPFRDHLFENLFHLVRLITSLV